MNRFDSLFHGLLYGNRFLAAVRMFMGILFIYASVFKIIRPLEFASVILKYDIVPVVLVPYMAIVLPYLELLLGLALVTGFRIRAASFIGMFLMAVFCVAISINIVRGNTFDCGCFELSRFGISETIGIKLVVRDFLFLAVFFFLFRARRHCLSLDSVIERDTLTNL